jgi:enterochelin esterase-like enzyme
MRQTMTRLGIVMAATLFGLIVFESGTAAQQAPPAQAPAPGAQAPAVRNNQGPARAVTRRPTPNDNGDFVIAGPYPAPPETIVRDGVPKGTVREFVFKSTESKIYPGVARNQTGVVPWERIIRVYTPAGYVQGFQAPLMIVQDGTLPRWSAFVPILDNMIHEKRMPATVVVFMASGGGDSRGSQRGLEYDTLNGTFGTFVETEALPRVTKEYGVRFANDPEGRVAIGLSSGGAAAFGLGWFHNDKYHRVLTYSGTYVDQQFPVNPETPHGAWDYHDILVPKAERKPLRIWLQVSQNDLGATREETSYRNFVMGNDRMAAILKAKGYPYQYVFTNDTGHADNVAITATLPLALEWIWKGYPIR